MHEALSVVILTLNISSLSRRTACYSFGHSKWAYHIVIKTLKVLSPTLNFADPVPKTPSTIEGDHSQYPLITVLVVPHIIVLKKWWATLINIHLIDISFNGSNGKRQVMMKRNKGSQELLRFWVQDIRIWT